MRTASSERQKARDLTLRPAISSDHEFIADLCRQAFLKFGSYDRYVLDWLREEIVAAFVAEVDSTPAGFFLLAAHPGSPPVAELLAIAVLPELRSQGIGGALLDRAIVFARESNPAPDELRLSVAETNARAQRLFARRGFRIGSAIGVYPAGQRALFMSKALRKEGTR